jgi:hypothetical protein
MDEVLLQRAPGRGMEIHMVKKVKRNGAAAR